MGEMYGNQWFNEFGDVPNASWIAEIERLTLDELTRGIDQCKRCGSPFAPRFPQFLNYCSDGLTREQKAFNARCKEGNDNKILRLAKPEPNADLSRRCAWIHADQAKGNKSIAVPLNNDAMVVLRSQIGKHETNVFTYKNKPVGVANTKAWRAALVRAGIDDFRWHDLRHTWASWHVQNGTPIHVLKELGGWADLTMVLRYAHLSSEHLSEFAENAKVGTNKLHAQKSPANENRRRA